MSGTRLDWLSLGLADSLKAKCCGSWFDDAITLPDQKGYNPAERVIINQVYSWR